MTVDCLRTFRLLTILFGSTLLIEQIQSLRFFPNKPDVSIDGLQDVSEAVRVNQIDHPISCLCDWNGDMYTDFLVLADNMIIAYLWDHEAYAFTQTLNISLAETTTIAGVVAADFDFDGRPDLLISSQYSSGPISLLKHSVYFQLPNGTVGEPLHVGKSSTQLLASNLFGAGKIDLFGADDSDQRSFWRNDLRPGGTGTFTKIAQPLPSGGPLLSKYLAPFHTSASLDLNSDCLPDLFIMTAICDDYGVQCEPSHRTNREFEFWIADKDQSSSNEKPPFLFSASISALAGVGMVSWADLDGDGDMDMAMSVKYRGQWRFIVLLYNMQQKKCCSSSEGCCSASEFEFRSIPSDTDPTTLKGEGITVVDLGGSPMVEETWNKHLTIPPWVRVGDYNLDGYPDFLLIQAFGSTKGVTRNVTLWQNVLCAGLGCETMFARGRTFALVTTTGVAALASVADPVAAFFFTLGEEGQEDIVAITRSGTGASATFHAVALFNNFYNDALYFKSLVTNSAWSGSKGDRKPYGSSLPGSVIKFTWADLNGDDKCATGVQQPSSTYMALSPPYSIFGLGRTNSYINQFYCGVHTNTDEPTYRTWLGLIPNSRVVVLPVPLTDPSRWWIEMYVSPSTVTIYVAISAIGALAALALPILYLHYRERKEDEAGIRQPFM